MGCQCSPQSAEEQGEEIVNVQKSARKEPQISDIEVERQVTGTRATVDFNPASGPMLLCNANQLVQVSRDGAKY